jgi:dUTP pyrophosphatase
MFEMNHAAVFGIKYSDRRYLLTKGSAQAAAYDLRARIEPHAGLCIEAGKRSLIPTGVFLELPKHFHALVLPRSGNALKKGLTVLNAPGLIDSDYRGEVGVILINHSDVDITIKDGDAIAQLLVQPSLGFEWTLLESLNETERGSKGFGSSGTAGQVIC